MTAMINNWGALHKIGRFRNIPTVGTFVNEFNFNLLMYVPTVGTFRKRPILCNAPLYNLYERVVLCPPLESWDFKLPPKKAFMKKRKEEKIGGRGRGKGKTEETEERERERETDSRIILSTSKLGPFPSSTGILSLKHMSSIFR